MINAWWFGKFICYTSKIDFTKKIKISLKVGIVMLIFYLFVGLYAVLQFIVLKNYLKQKIMKKITVLSLVGIFTLSSFNLDIMKTIKTTVELQRWYYKCKDGRTGSFLMERGAEKSAAYEIANALCS